MYVKDVTILLSGDQIRKVSGTIMVSATVSLCKDMSAAKLHEFKMPFKVE